MLELQTEILGKRHPDTLCSMMGLAFSFSALGRKHEALELTVLLVDCLKQETTLDSKASAAHALRRFTWDRERRAPCEASAELVLQAGAVPLLIELCRSNETVGIGFIGLDNLTCLHEVRVKLMAEGVFDIMISLLLDAWSNSLLDMLGQMCLDAECVNSVRGNGPLVDLVLQLSHSESAETKRFAESILNKIAP